MIRHLFLEYIGRIKQFALHMLAFIWLGTHIYPDMAQARQFR